MTPQQLHAILGQALRESEPAAMLHPAAAWPVFQRICVPAAMALRAGELYFWWGTDEEAGYRRFYVEFRCTHWWVKAPWRDDSEFNLWSVDLAFARPAEPATDALGSGEHECLDVEAPGNERMTKTRRTLWECRTLRRPAQSIRYTISDTERGDHPRVRTR